MTVVFSGIKTDNTAGLFVERINFESNFCFGSNLGGYFLCIQTPYLG